LRQCVVLEREKNKKKYQCLNNSKIKYQNLMGEIHVYNYLSVICEGWHVNLVWKPLPWLHFTKTGSLGP
jgi:hypothetical protein